MFYRRAFKEHLLLTNTVASIFIGGCGDYVEQRLERIQSNDWRRTGRFCILGLTLGPLEHFWYMLLDRMLPGTSHKMVGMKVIVDEVVYTPPLYCIFYPGMALMEGRTRHEAMQELREKFWPTVKVDCMLLNCKHAQCIVLVPNWSDRYIV